MTFPGMPSIFYGDELGLEGIQEADYRQPMPWNKVKAYKENESDSLYVFYAEILIYLRRRENVFTQRGFRLYILRKMGVFTLGKI